MTNSSDDYFALVRMPQPGPRRDAILRDAAMVGNLDAVMEQLPDTKARTKALTDMFRIADDAVAAEHRRDVARADARRARDEARDIQVLQLSGAIDALTRRMDAMEEEHARLVAADKAQRIREALADLNTHHPTGELHSLGPTESRLPAGETEIDTADARDGNGDLPEPKDPTGVSIHPASHFSVDTR